MNQVNQEGQNNQPSQHNNQTRQMMPPTQEDRKNQVSSQGKDQSGYSSPSYEQERKQKEEVSSADTDSSQTKLSGSSGEIGEEDEETNLNESPIQEGPKGSRPPSERRSA